MRILAIASASGGCAAALVENDVVLAAQRIDAAHGLADDMAPMLARLLADDAPPDAVAVVVGPGSFTGLRAGIAVGTGVALAAGIPIVGVTLTEAIAAALPDIGGRALWVASAARTGFVFLDRAGILESVALDRVPKPAGPVAVAGDAANFVAASLAARGVDVMLTHARQALPRHVAAVAARRLAGEVPPCPPLPLYSEAPRISRPAGSPRPPPVAT